MAISDHDRYELYRWLEESAGAEVAETMMAHLPPVGWADVATRRDLEQLGDRMRAELQHELRVVLLVLVGLMVSLFSAGAALFG